MVEGDDKKLVLQFVGDISLNGLFCDPQYQLDLTKNMVDIAECLGTCDLRCGNFESPLWGGQGFNLLKSPRVCTTHDAAKCLVPLNLNVVFLANNHAYDCLKNGWLRTVQFMDENKVFHLGVGNTKNDAAAAVIVNRNGFSVALLNYLGQETNPNIPSDAGIYVNLIEKDRLLTEVSEMAKSNDCVVVNLHWGKYELVRYPTDEQRKLARLIIEAGAKLVVGHHSHCMQGYESWKDGYIFYSLGNFLFGGLKGRENQQWPKHCRQVAVATCVFTENKRLTASMDYFLQKGLMLVKDSTSARRKKQEVLNSRLRLESCKYVWHWRFELFLQWGILAPFRFIKSSGGLCNAVKRFRWQHVTALLHIILRSK